METQEYEPSGHHLSSSFLWPHRLQVQKLLSRMLRAPGLSAHCTTRAAKSKPEWLLPRFPLEDQQEQRETTD